MVKVELEGVVTELSIKGSTIILDIMTSLKITPEEYVSILNGEVVTEREPLSKNDELKFVRVWSGG
ncbi:MAG: hypothetical protein GOV01_03965 [Candidatus Altiarchaeota archaeon]|nr:hypothetical protein [Candidatus Altiarchaeota archaeon]